MNKILSLMVWSCCLSMPVWAQSRVLPGQYAVPVNGPDMLVITPDVFGDVFDSPALPDDADIDWAAADADADADMATELDDDTDADMMAELADEPEDDTETLIVLPM
jgi:hypothetical protein